MTEQESLEALCERLEHATPLGGETWIGLDLTDRATLIAAVRARGKALETIEAWSDFPETGKTWNDGTAMVYGVCYGSNGERDYMRGIAKKALEGT